LKFLKWPRNLVEELQIQSRTRNIDLLVLL
jgi:hypothetical protein